MDIWGYTENETLGICEINKYQNDLNENSFFSKKLKVRITFLFAVLL